MIDPRPHRLLFLVLDTATRSVLLQRLRTMFAYSMGPDEQSWPIVAMDDLSATADVIIATGVALLSWARRCEADPCCRVVYVQPELLIVDQALEPPWPSSSVQRRAWEALRGLDRRLNRLPVLSMEALYGGGPGLASRLADCLGEILPAAKGAQWPDLAPTLEAYKTAMAILLRPQDLALPSLPSQGEVLCGRLSMGSGGEGCHLLGRGWADPEAGFTWTHGTAASLHLPPQDKDRICRLSGWLIIHPLRPVKVLFRLNGRPVGQVVGHEGEPSAFVFDVGLPAAHAGDHRLDILVVEPVRPIDIGAGEDRRPLGLALATVELLVPPTSEDGDIPTCLEDPLVRDLMARHPADLAVVVSEDVEVGGRAGALCAERGCAEVLVVSPVPAAHEAISRPFPVGRVSRIAVGLDGLAARLENLGAHVDLVILCDEASIANWFETIERQGSAPLQGASLVLNTGNPYACTRAFNWYASRWAGLITCSDGVCLVECGVSP